MICSAACHHWCSGCTACLLPCPTATFCVYTELGNCLFFSELKIFLDKDFSFAAQCESKPPGAVYIWSPVFHSGSSSLTFLYWCIWSQDVLNAIFYFDTLLNLQAAQSVVLATLASSFFWSVLGWIMHLNKRMIFNKLQQKKVNNTKIFP